ncbi:MAG: DUF3106 domain-containing protein [Burkholderiales bacterium]|nr:DUF3106 domain-containing protein [Burkholderiales bacterium]
MKRPAMTRGLLRHAIGLAVAVFALAAGGVALAQTAAPTPIKTPVPPPPFTSPAPRAESGVRWQALTPAQRQALAPLEREWSTIDAPRKQKWLAIADRYPSLPPQERDRIGERMNEWARLTPAERGEMRLRYQEAQQVPAPDRSAKWQEYQNLPPDAKQQFAARAAASAAPARPDPFPASKTAPTAREGTQGKANVVPNPALAQKPKPVAPTVVQASPGATTRLITRPVTPPAHQQSGMPKIAATPEFVNGSTLLPKRGPQAAAVVKVPAPPLTVAAPTAPSRPVAPVAKPAKAAEPTPQR